MSFRVGQRVRKIAHTPRLLNVPSPRSLGIAIVPLATVGTIIAQSDAGPDLWCVNYDGFADIHRVAAGNCIEPIRDDDTRILRQETTTWDKCVWQPSQVSA